MPIIHHFKTSNPNILLISSLWGFLCPIHPGCSLCSFIHIQSAKYEWNSPFGWNPSHLSIMSLGSPPSITFLYRISMAGKSQQTISKFLKRVPSSIICWQTFESSIALLVVNSLTVSLLLSHPQQGLILRQLRKSQTVPQVTFRGWISLCRFSQSKSPSPKPKIIIWLPAGTVASTWLSTFKISLLKSYGFVIESKDFLQTSFPMSSINIRRGKSFLESLLRPLMFPIVFPASPPFTPVFWQSLLLHMFQSLKYLQTECDLASVLVWPVQPDSCGTSNSSAILGKRSLQVPFLIIEALNHLSGIEKCAPAESPITATPILLYSAQNLSSQSLPRLSIPKIPLQS